MKRFSLVSVLLFAVGVFSNNAYATGFSIVAGPNLNMSSLSTGVAGVATVDITGGVGFDAGFLVDFTVAGNGPEIGALYQSIKTKTASTILGVAQPDSESTSKFIHIPALWRFGGAMWSFGAGGFYDLALDSGGSANYGIEAGPRITFTKLFVDARFDLGLKDNSGLKTKGAVLLVGIHL